MVCVNDVNVQTITYSTAQQYIKEGKCAEYVLQSQPGIYITNHVL